MSTISLALCTFNGAKYLEDQLNSYMHQTRPPDELIVCDDHSTDNTVNIVKDFSTRTPFSLKLFINDHTLGPTQNFHKAIEFCTGDLIALSDQDDLWNSTKLERYERIFEDDSRTGLVFSNAEIVDESLNPLGYDMWRRCNFTPHEQKMVENDDILAVLLKHYLVTGSTMMFRSEFKSAILPIPNFWFHDAWIALLLASMSHIVFISEPMTKYRQHSRNHLGGIKNNIIREIHRALQTSRDEYYRLEMLRYDTLHCRLLELKKNFNISKDILLLDDKIEHLRVRQNMPKKRLRRLPFIVDELRRLRYSRYARNWGSLAMDLLLR